MGVVALLPCKILWEYLLLSCIEGLLFVGSNDCCRGVENSRQGRENVMTFLGIYDSAQEASMALGNAKVAQKSCLNFALHASRTLITMKTSFSNNHGFGIRKYDPDVVRMPRNHFSYSLHKDGNIVIYGFRGSRPMNLADLKDEFDTCVRSQLPPCLQGTYVMQCAYKNGMNPRSTGVQMTETGVARVYCLVLTVGSGVSLEKQHETARGVCRGLAKASCT